MFFFPPTVIAEKSGQQNEKKQFVCVNFLPAFAVARVGKPKEFGAGKQKQSNRMFKIIATWGYNIRML